MVNNEIFLRKKRRPCGQDISSSIKKEEKYYYPLMMNLKKILNDLTY